MFKKFSPNDYPIHLSVSFSKRQSELKSSIKTTLDTIPKNQAKYQNKGKYVNTFDCYFKDIDAMRPLLNNVLRHTEMYISYVLEADERVFVNDILSKANSLFADKGLNK